MTVVEYARSLMMTVAKSGSLVRRDAVVLDAVSGPPDARRQPQLLQRGSLDFDRDGGSGKADEAARKRT